MKFIMNPNYHALNMRLVQYIFSKARHLKTLGSILVQQWNINGRLSEICTIKTFMLQNETSLLQTAYFIVKCYNVDIPQAMQYCDKVQDCWICYNAIA